MGNLDTMASSSAIKREDNILRLLGMIRRGAQVPEIILDMGVKTRTIHSYLVTIQDSQFSVPEYCDYLRNLDVEGDKFKQEQLESWLTRLRRFKVTEDSDKFAQPFSKEFSDELHYLLWVFKKIK